MYLMRSLSTSYGFRQAGSRARATLAALSHNVIRPNLLTLRPTYSYEMIAIDNKLFSPTIKIRYEV
jgi:hypothetical protein